MDPEKKTVEPDVIVAAVPAGDSEYKPPTGGGGDGSGQPIPPQHTRFYCSSCRTPYDLPNGSTSWRCANCHTFNSTTPDQCPWCVVM
ncbi:unnamed protein product [Cylindrotheca closterium]|uniref:RanBP2-type domain-containing protein n=1 Tax=Cylindrotheca closterium TaxID=2856 RepID=A0AAD2JKE0_9STRA|nr:unnamed protein product [Cylindrotheca closterium]